MSDPFSVPAPESKNVQSVSFLTPDKAHTKTHAERISTRLWVMWNLCDLSSPIETLTPLVDVLAAFLEEYEDGHSQAVGSFLVRAQAFFPGVEEMIGRARVLLDLAGISPRGALSTEAPLG